jgi:hypothetical protein
MRNHFIFYEKFNLFYFYFLIMNTGFFSGDWGLGIGPNNFFNMTNIHLLKFI